MLLLLSLLFFIPILLDDQDGTKTEPQSPTSCCHIFENLGLEGEDVEIRVDFPDLKLVYHKTQSRANRQSRQRVVKGKIKVRVLTQGHQVQTIEVYVERTPNAALLVGDKCGRVYLKSQPGTYFPNKVKKKGYVRRLLQDGDCHNSSNCFWGVREEGITSNIIICMFSWLSCVIFDFFDIVSILKLVTIFLRRLRKTC